MSKAVRILLAMAALAAPAALVAGCGGVPGNAVAEVDGEAIEKSSYDHWLQVAARSSGQGAAAKAPVPPDFTACVAQKRKTTPKPAKGQPKVTDEQLKTQCKQEYEQLRDQVLQLLISFQWLEGEAAEQDIKVSDAEVKKAFEEQKKQSFPKDADYQKFLKDSGQSEADLLLQVKADLLASKIRDKVVKGKDKVSDAQIEDFYNKNKERFAQPERRDIRVVLTKGAGEGEPGQAGDPGRPELQGGRQEVLDRRGLQGAGRQAARAGRGHAREAARRGRLQGQEGPAHRAGQDPVRPLRLRRHEDHARLAADARAGEGDDPPDAAVPEPAEGAGVLLQGLLRALEGEDGLPRGLRDPAVQAGPEVDADADSGRPAGAAAAARRAERPAMSGTSDENVEALRRLDELTRRLRVECPWDREQDERTIVPHTVEEAYELAAAAHSGDDAQAARRARRRPVPGPLPRAAARGARAAARWPTSPSTCTPSSSGGTRTSSARWRPTTRRRRCCATGTRSSPTSRAASPGIFGDVPENLPGRCTPARSSAAPPRPASTSSTCPTTRSRASWRSCGTPRSARSASTRSATSCSRRSTWRASSRSIRSSRCGPPPTASAVASRGRRAWPHWRAPTGTIWTRTSSSRTTRGPA